MPAQGKGISRSGWLQLDGKAPRYCIHKALEIVHEQVDFNQDQVLNNILSFFKERYKQMMLRSDYQSDLIEAIISAEFDQIHTGQWSERKRPIKRIGKRIQSGCHLFGHLLSSPYCWVIEFISSW